MIYTFLSFIDILKGIGDTILSILIFAIVLGLIIGIHEAGHFFFARRGGILCREYAIGMGPILWKKKKGETLYSLRAIPLGGFCAIAGEELEEDPFKGLEKIKLVIDGEVIKGFYLYDNESLNDMPSYTIKEYDIFDEAQTGNLFMKVETEEGEEITFTVDPQAMLYVNKKTEMQIAPYNRTLNSKSKSRRALVMFGGPLMNFLLALVVFFIVGLCTGFTDYNSNVVNDVEVESNIYELGLRDGDSIIKMSCESLGEKEISSWNDLSSFMDSYRTGNYIDEKIVVTYKDKDENVNTVSAIPFVALNNLGIGSNYTHQDDGKVVIKAYAELDSSLGNNSGLKLDDEIIKINGKNINSWKEVVEVFKDYNSDENVKMVVLRDEKEVEVEVRPYSKDLMDNQTSITGNDIPSVSIVLGVGASSKFSFIKSVGYAFRRTGESFLAVFQTLKLLFTKTVSVTNLSGPIGIFQLTSQAKDYGILYILSLVGLLSVNIGLLNLFPIPALDGGRLVFVAYEAVTGKKPNPKVETILITVTMILLMGLMVVVAFSDIMRFFK